MIKDFAPWGYKPMYYTDGIEYTKDEIMAMFEKPFRCEDFDYTKKQWSKEDKEREKMREYLKERLARPIDETPDGEKLVPIPWLKPKAEFMVGELYE